MNPLPPFAIITGGSSGIGLACARMLAARGHRVALLARDPTRLAQAARELQDRGHQIETSAVDVGDAGACHAAIEALIARFGAPDWLITSAGVAEPGAFLDQALDAHETQMRVNYFGTLAAALAAVPAMAARGRGRVLFVSSGAALIGVTGFAGYAPSKFAVRGLAEVLRVELAPHGVSVTVAFPPDTDTPQLAAERPLRPAAAARFLAKAPIWSAEAVARHAVSTAEAGRFVSAPGWSMRLLWWFGGLASPFVRAAQRRAHRRTRSD